MTASQKISITKSSVLVAKGFALISVSNPDEYEPNVYVLLPRLNRTSESVAKKTVKSHGVMVNNR